MQAQNDARPGGVSLITLLLRLVILLAVLAAILFVSAGRLDWIQAWAFCLAYGAFLLFYSTWTRRNDPAQLAERSRMASNVKGWDKAILSVYTVLLIVLLVVAGLDAGRFRWAPAPAALQAVGWIGLALAGGLIWWAASVNTYLSRYVRIQEERGQQAVTSGPYRWVRHPMYSGVILFMLCAPLALGSLWALLPGALIGVCFALRTYLEDRTLLAELPGYADFAKKTRYRLTPGVW